MQAIAEFKKGKVEYRADKTGIVHIPFGKVDFYEEDLLVNLIAAVVRAKPLFFSAVSETLPSQQMLNHFIFLFRQRSVETNKPSGAKGVYWKSAHICSSMGPSIRLNIREMLDYKLPSNV